MVRNILITGGAGYIGSHIALELLKSKFNVAQAEAIKAETDAQTAFDNSEFKLV